MKNIIRAFVVALAITGFAAASHVAAAAQTNPDKVTMSKNSSFPVPMCPPDDPTGCGNAPGSSLR